MRPFLVGILILLLPTLIWASSEGEEVYFSWAPIESQVQLWLSGAPAVFPPGGPVVSLKVCTPRRGPASLEVLSQEWTGTPSTLPGLVSGPPVALGARSVWRGIPYQEVLVRPLRAGATGTVEVLSALSVRLGLEGLQAEAAASGRPPTEVAALFVNPGDVVRLGPGVARDARQSARDRREAFPSGLLMPRFRVAVSADGIVRMDRDYLLSRGFDPAGLDPLFIHLTSRGRELPIWVEGEGDGSFDPGDAIVFYGQKMTVPDRDVWNGGDFTDADIYWLTLDSQPGLRMVQVAASPVSGYPEVTQFPCTFTTEENSFLFNWYHLRPNRDLWFWGGFYGGVPGSHKDFAVTIPRPASTAGQITAFVGASTDTNHEAVPTLNGFTPTFGPPSLLWSGLTVGEETFQFGSGLQAGANTLTLTSTGSDYQVADRFEVSYQRTLEAQGDSLFLTVPADSSLFRPHGFSLKPTVLDLSDEDAPTGLFLPKLLTGAAFSDLPNLGTAAFEASGTRFALDAAPSLPDSVEICISRDLLSPSLSADLLIVTHPDFHPAGQDTEWQAYLSRRRATMDVEVVDIQEVYDNFSHGIFDPTAIRAFLQAAQGSWAKFPSSLLLVGDGTYDYKDYGNRVGVEPTYKNWVPTMMFEDLSDSSYLGRYPSDAWFADLDGDGYPDLSVGRLPARSYGQLAGLLTKIMNYEDQALSPDTPWYKTHLYVGDTWDEPWEQDAFEDYNEALRTAYSNPPWSWERVFYHDPPYSGTNSTLCASAIREKFPQSAILHYSGHSGYTFWSGHQIFSSQKIRNGNTESDVDLLAETPRLPFLVNSTCYTSAFCEPTIAPLNEELVGRATRGAIGTVGPSTIAYTDEEETFASALYGQAFGRYKVRTLGELVDAGRFALPTAIPRAQFNYVLLGDPTLRLRLPAPPPPESLAATAGDASVDLSWSPDPGASGYLVDRSEDGGATWTRVTPSALPGTQFTLHDGGLVNTREYRYAVFSVDPEGFVGAPSGSATAIPLNPAPPQVPSGLRVADPGLETVLEVGWTANPESDLDSYLVARGTSPGSYDHFTDLPAGTSSLRVTGLVSGQRYYFALRARNTSGRESDYCAEISGVPSGLKLAVRPPAAIVDLKVVAEGQDLRLSWSQPLVDIGGEAISVTRYTVYRVSGRFDWSVDGVPYSEDDWVEEIDTPSKTTWTDIGAVALPDPVTYLVVAWSVGGFASPASVAPPAPVLDLRATRSVSTGRTLLSFSPVTSTVEGTSCILDHYEVFGFYPSAVPTPSDHVSPAPSRIAISAPLPPCESCTFLCDDAAVPPPLYYSVVAVDRRGNRSLY